MFCRFAQLLIVLAVCTASRLCALGDPKAEARSTVAVVRAFDLVGRLGRARTGSGRWVFPRGLTNRDDCKLRETAQFSRSAPLTNQLAIFATNQPARSREMSRWSARVGDITTPPGSHVNMLPGDEVAFTLTAVT
jgi:hypothetical protein